MPDADGARRRGHEAVLTDDGEEGVNKAIPARRGSR